MKPEIYRVIEDCEDFVAVNKNHGVLSQSGKDSSISVIEALKKEYEDHFIHLLNRVDRPVGGLVLLAKSRSFLRFYEGLQHKGAVEKRYVAIVEGFVDNAEEGIHRHFLSADRRQKKAVISLEKTKDAKEVELNLHVLEHFDRYTAIEMVLSGGKFHQIRAQLGFLGHPIRGDVKYGARRGHRDRSIDLHGQQISWSSKNKGKITIRAPILKNDSLWQMLEAKLRTKK